jgi:hypothetical protein
LALCSDDVDAKAHPVHLGRKIQGRHGGFERELQIRSGGNEGTNQAVESLFCEIARRTQPDDFAIDTALDEAPVQVNIARNI